MTTTIPGYRWVRTSFDPEGRHFETYRCVTCNIEMKDEITKLPTELRDHRERCKDEETVPDNVIPMRAARAETP